MTFLESTHSPPGKCKKTRAACSLLDSRGLLLTASKLIRRLFGSASLGITFAVLFAPATDYEEFARHWDTSLDTGRSSGLATQTHPLERAAVLGCRSSAVACSPVCLSAAVQPYRRLFMMSLNPNGSEWHSVDARSFVHAVQCCSLHDLGMLW